MPRTGPTYALPSPPAPLVSGTLAKAEDLNAIQNDIALALTNSVPTDGSAPLLGNLNLNAHNITNVGTLTTAALTVTGPSNLASVIATGNVQTTGAFVGNGGGDITGGLNTDNLSASGTIIAVGNLQADGGVFATGGGDITGGFYTDNLTATGAVQGAFLKSTGAGEIDGGLSVTGSSGLAVTAGPVVAPTMHSTGSILCDGNITAASYSTISDARMKLELGSYDAGIEELVQLRPVRYRLQGQPDEQVGLLAQEVETVLPECVSTITTDALPDLRMLDSGPVLMALVNSVRELAQRVARLERR